MTCRDLSRLLPTARTRARANGKVTGRPATSRDRWRWPTTREPGEVVQTPQSLGGASHAVGPAELLDGRRTAPAAPELLRLLSVPSAKLKPSKRPLVTSREDIRRRTEASFRLSFQWPPLQFRSTSRVSRRSSCTMWHTNSCSMMVTESLLIAGGLKMAAGGAHD